MNERPVRVLMVEPAEAPVARRLQATDEVKVVATSSSPKDALVKASSLRPEAIVLDFAIGVGDALALVEAFRLRTAAPVFVLCTENEQAEVFAALEKGAFDFVPCQKPWTVEGLSAVEQALTERLGAVGAKRSGGMPSVQARLRPVDEPKIVVIGASTGGPSALQHLFEALPPDPRLSFVITQHMPQGFIETFSRRLAHSAHRRVTHVVSSEPIRGGDVLVSPGDAHVELKEREGQLWAERVPATLQDRYVPSVDRLFASAAHVLGSATLGLVLTGMGTDGALGALALRRVGAQVWAQSEESASIFSMPCEAIATGAVQRILSLDDIPAALLAWVRLRQPSPQW
jgi:two-component system, chemotaxis family, protein-glutamate methylesterase/glutaminase